VTVLTSGEVQPAPTGNVLAPENLSGLATVLNKLRNFLRPSRIFLPQKVDRQPVPPTEVPGFRDIVIAMENANESLLRDLEDCGLSIWTVTPQSIKVVRKAWTKRYGRHWFKYARDEFGYPIITCDRRCVSPTVE
jgi:hypothetical protein